MERKQLRISDAPMFEHVMRNEEVCRETLEAILGFKIAKVTFHDTEHSLEPRLGSHGVRLDAYLQGEDKVFDIEMQSYQRGHLDMRMRYYQSSIDSVALEKGKDYDSLPESYIIFVCLEDPFGKDEPRYEIERECVNIPNVNINCKAHWTALNASAYEDVSDKELANLLNYIADGTVGDSSLVRKINDMVSKANNDSRWVRQAMSVMTIEEDAAMQIRIAKRDVERAKQDAARMVAKARAEAKAEAVEARVEMERKAEQETNRYKKLTSALIEANRIDDLSNAIESPEAFEKLCKEFGI